MRCFLRVLIILIVSISAIQCGKGIEPEPEMREAGFGGMIFFSGDWPENVTRTHIVAFKNPLNNGADFNAFNLGYVSFEIPYGVTEFRYSTLDSSLFPINEELKPGTYSYVAVAQQTTEELTLNRADWYVTGIYLQPESDSIPGVISFQEGEFLDNVNIYCDFASPPPQPPGNQP
jgi:hypothetical protein